MNGRGTDSNGVFGRIPQTQIIEKRTDSTRSAVKDPVAQARHLALGWATLVLSLISAILAFGSIIFWLAVLIVSLSTFLWFLWQASRTEYITEDGTQVGVAPAELIAALLLSALAGGIAWSLWKVVSVIIIAVTLPPWLASWLPQVAALGSLLGVVFSAAYIVHLEPAFLQELMYRSPAIEQGLGNLISQKDTPFWVGRRPSRPLPDPTPSYTDLRIMYTEENGDPKAQGLHSENITLLYPPPQLRKIAQVITTDGISERTLCGSNGKPFPGGAGGRLALDEFKVVLQGRKWGRQKIDGSPTQGFILTKLGENVFHGLAGTTPPHRQTSVESGQNVGLDERTNARTIEEE